MQQRLLQPPFRARLPYGRVMKHDNWRRLSALAMGLALALALVMVASYVIQGTDQRDIGPPAASQPGS